MSASSQVARMRLRICAIKFHTYLIIALRKFTVTRRLGLNLFKKHENMKNRQLCIIKPQNQGLQVTERVQAVRKSKPMLQ